MIHKIHLQNFRNFSNQTFEFSEKITVIVGPNAAGKTNLLESIFLLSTGKSFKSGVEKDLIQENKTFTRVKGLLDDQLKLEIILTTTHPKKLLLNGVSKRLIDFAGNLKVVLFSPQDLDLVTASPSLRRKFLDHVLSLTDHQYHRSLISYDKGLRARNKLLFQIRESQVTKLTSQSQLLFWNQLLIKNGDYISHKREDFLNFINVSSQIGKEIFQLTYDKSAISESRLEKYAHAEIASATTLVGPHRDDFIFNINTKNLDSFGSRGEQRMAVLWLKLAELAFIKQETKEKPTLLLDDIFSELDASHRKIVFAVSQNQQTIITTADENFLTNFKVDTKIDLS